MCWVLLNLGLNDHWREKVVSEVKALVANHSDTTSPDPLYKRLATIPLEAWESDLPSLDLVVRETIRVISSSGTMLRRNMDRELQFESGEIHKGDFLAYPVADIHMDPDVYPDPKKFDPGRYLEGREEDKKVSQAFLGWGVGKVQRSPHVQSLLTLLNVG